MYAVCKSVEIRANVRSRSLRIGRQCRIVLGGLTILLHRYLRHVYLCVQGHSPSFIFAATGRRLECADGASAPSAALFGTENEYDSERERLSARSDFSSAADSRSVLLFHFSARSRFLISRTKVPPPPPPSSALPCVVYKITSLSAANMPRTIRRPP